MKDLKKLLQLALLVAIEVVLSRFLSINLPIVRIGFAFVPVALMAIKFGPLWAAAGNAAGDLIGSILFPIGPYFPGFTVTAFFSGLVYGLFLYKKPLNWWRIGLCCSFICIVLFLGVDTFWLQMLSGKGYLALLPPRIVKNLIMIPIQTIVIKLITSRLPSAISENDIKPV